MYELDEALLAPEGSPVQCTRCNHVFTARPARASGQTLVGVPAAPEAAPPVAPPAPAAPSPRWPEVSAPAPAAPAPAAPAAASRTARPVSFSRPGPQVYRPSTSSAPPPVSRPPALRRDTLGAFEARLRRSARWKWLVPTAAIAVVAIAAAAWLFLSRRSSPDADRARAEGLALVALDDAGSLDEAARMLGGVAESSPFAAAAAADRALAQLLRASAWVEEGEALAARAAERVAERDRLRRDAPPGWEEQERVVAADADKLGAEVRAHEAQARTLSTDAFGALTQLDTGRNPPPEVGRALATYYALGGEHDKLERAATRDRAAQDPWTALARASLDARAKDAPAREKAASALVELATRYPEMLRARVLLARTQAGLGRRAEALATLDGVLAANARHEGAKALRAALARPAVPPAPAAAPPAEPPAPAAVAKPAPLPRKPFAQPGASPAPGAGAAAPAARAFAPSSAAPAVAPAAKPAPSVAPAPGTPPPAAAKAPGSGSAGTGPESLTPAASPSPGALDGGTGSTGAPPRPAKSRPPAREPVIENGGG